MIQDPTHDCPACGNPAPWVGPVFRSRNYFLDGTVWPAYLAWTCRRCGNETTKPTLLETEIQERMAANLPEPKRSWWARMRGRAV